MTDKPDMLHTQDVSYTQGTRDMLDTPVTPDTPDLPDGRRRWLQDVCRGMQIMAWAGLVGAQGANVIIFLIGVWGRLSTDLWMARFWLLGCHFIVLVGLMTLTRGIPVGKAAARRVAFARTVRIVGILWFIACFAAVWLGDAAWDTTFAQVVSLGKGLTALAADLLALWYVAGLLLCFGARRLGCVVQWIALVQLGIGLASSPTTLLVIHFAGPSSPAFTALIWGMRFVSVALPIGVCWCLVAAARKLRRVTEGRCLNCGYVLYETTRCSECGMESGHQMANC